MGGGGHISFDVSLGGGSHLSFAVDRGGRLKDIEILKVEP